MSYLKYTGDVKFNNSIEPLYQGPLDTRLVAEDIRALYITKGTSEKTADLYNKAYTGMPIIVMMSNEPVLMTLKDATPYTPGTVITINEQNYKNYWIVVGKDVRDYVNDTLVPTLNSSINRINSSIFTFEDITIPTLNSSINRINSSVSALESIIVPTINSSIDRIDSSISKLETFINTTNISNASNGSTTISSIDGSIGKTYTISINVDNDTVKTVDNHLTTGKYKIKKLETATTGMFATYKLSYKSPDASSYIDLGDSIDIPKDYVLKEVHVCKAKTEDDKLIETHRLTDTSISVWDSDTNPVYLHFIWLTEDSSTATSESFVKVSDMISVDITDVSTRLNSYKNNIDSSIDYLKNYTSDTSTRFNSYVELNDSSITYLKTYTNDTSVRFDLYLTNTDSSIDYIKTYTNDTSVRLNNYVESTDSSIERLNSSVSNIITNIESTNVKFIKGDSDVSLRTLTAHGNLPKNTSIGTLETMSISDILKSILFETAIPVKIKEASLVLSIKPSSVYKTTVDVGMSLPTSSEFNIQYTPETYQWVSSQDNSVKGDEVALSRLGALTYYKNNTNYTSGGSTTWSGSVTEGINGYWYASCELKAGNYAVDSLNSSTNKGLIYAAPKTGTITSNTVTLTGSWRIYSNATIISTSSLWSHRNDNISSSDYAGKDSKNDSNIFCDNSKTIYALYPKQTTSEQPFYIYVPNTYSISSINGANNVVNAFDIPKTITSPTTIDITNNYSKKGTFKRYEIEKSAGNTCIMINIIKL